MEAAEPTRTLVIGAGGHARMCVEILLADDTFEPVGAVSSDGSGRGGLGVPVLGRDDDWRELAESEDATTFCVAIGDNSIRQAWTENLTERGGSTAIIVSPSAVVSATATLGAGCQVMPAAVITAATSIGDGTIVNTNASVDHDGTIGRFVHIAPGVAIGGDVTIGDRSFVGIGARVLPGVAIGSDVTVGAGAVVVRDVPDGVTVVGVPARQVDR